MMPLQGIQLVFRNNYKSNSSNLLLLIKTGSAWRNSVILILHCFFNPKF